METLLDHLEAINRKERYFVFTYATGNADFRLSSEFRNAETTLLLRRAVMVTMATANNDEAEREGRQQLLTTASRLYEQFGRPLEQGHSGEFVAIAPDGRTVLGTSVHEVGRRAKAAFGSGNFVFKIGPRVVGKWR